MLNHNCHNNKTSKPTKSFVGVQMFWAVFQKRPLAAEGILIIIFLFLIPVFTQAAGQYRVISWKGDVKIKKGEAFIRLVSGRKYSLNESDVLRIAGGASVKLGFPGDIRKVFYGPRFTKVGTLEKSEKGPSTIADLIKNIGIEELFSRKKEEIRGTTRAGSSALYKKIKKAIREIEEPPQAEREKKELAETLDVVGRRFDAAPIAEQVLIRARIFKHFNRYKQAAETVFNYYEHILKVKGKKKEKAYIVSVLINEYLPVKITFNGKERFSTRFSSNFKLWWAAFSFDGRELREIEKTIDTHQNPQYTFNVRHVKTRRNQYKSQYLFIIAGSDWSELEKFDVIKTAKKELLRREIPVSSPGKVTGLGKVIIKIGLNKIKNYN